MTFAMEAGFMSEQEQADAQKMLVALKKGAKPPNCRGKDECDIYCQQEEHFEECLSFAEAAGFMSAEDAAMARKTGGKGPGDCKDKEECEAFCNSPDNQETCFNFAKEHGLIAEEDLKRMEEGTRQFKQSLEQAPPEVLDCLNAQLGNGMLEKLRTGAVMPPREIGESMRSCYEKMGPPPGQGGPGEGGDRTPGDSGGQPGNFQPNCENPEQCPQPPSQLEQMMPPNECQGENCGFGPPPEQPNGQQPPESSSAWPQPPAGENSIQQQPPFEGQQPIMPPTPPVNQEQPLPPQPGENPSPPPPSGFLAPKKFLASLISPFIQVLWPEK